MSCQASNKRLENAKAVASFFAPRLAAVDMRSEGTLIVRDVTDEPLSHDEWATWYVTPN